MQLALDSRLPEELQKYLIIPISPGCPTDGPLTTLESSRPSRRTSIIESLSAGPLTSSFDTTVALQDRTQQRIWPGTYVAFALSTEHLMKGFPEGSEIYKKLRSFDAGRYLGLVTSTFPHWSEESAALGQDIVVHFVARTASLPSPVSEHWMPIFPGSEPRQEKYALRTTMLFPWRDYQQWTTLGVRLRVIRTHTSTLVFELEHDEFARFEDSAGRDYGHLDSTEPQWGNDDRNTISKLVVSPYALPGEIWLDVRSREGDKEPTDFIEEIALLER
ncbi:hypothetical protein BV22DRAFT_1134168 [Leucogyrophana mollusca]|uniref:Uncharacterized protein n=1 Tax=Leucogyrophana mollusca TaxID=85980 RepID=A0ACB8B0H2_9AGAM|nr:hypothetical protein BV22DRAFT_1134168 [Leucogyrophana mollusca]